MTRTRKVGLMDARRPEETDEQFRKRIEGMSPDEFMQWQARRYAESKYISWGIGHSQPEDDWALTTGDGKTWRWHEGDQPGLGNFLDRVATQLHGSWHLARTELSRTAGSREGGETSAETRRDNSTKTPAILREAERLINRNINPWDRITRITETTGASRTWVSKKLQEKYKNLKPK